jgi:hypothetical protein
METVKSGNDKTKELSDKSTEFLLEAKKKGLVASLNGSLPDLFNEVAEKAYSDETQTDFRAKLEEFAAFYHDPDTQDAIPCFGIQVGESETGEIRITFAD